MSTARTVLGDVPAAALGAVDYHEHLFQVSALLPGDELDDEDRSGQEARLLQESGFHTMVEATPCGLGRRPGAMARVSRRSSLQVVATTGAHRQAHYPSGHRLRAASVDELTAWFVRDIEIGMGPDTEDAAGSTPDRQVVTPRAGLLKAGVDYWSVSAFERRVLDAVSAAHARTDAPVMVHLEQGSAAHEVLDILQRQGVHPSAVVLAHIDRNPDAGLHVDLAARGAYLGYDGAGRSRSWPDSTLVACLVESAGRGASSRILLGGDVARASRYVAYGGLPGMAYLAERFVPRVLAEGGEELVARVLQENPQRLLARFP